MIIFHGLQYTKYHYGELHEFYNLQQTLCVDFLRKGGQKRVKIKAHTQHYVNEEELGQDKK